jgi:hypothetical protein
MSIRVICPNGHVLNVKDTLAGKSGLCPKCKAKVEVPEVKAGEFSEDVIMTILGPNVSGPSVSGVGGRAVAPRDSPVPIEPSSAVPLMVERNLPPKKSCHKCHREILAEIHICPFCHTYIAELSDF